MPKRARTVEQIQVDLEAVRARKEENREERDDIFAQQNALFDEGKAAGMTAVQMAEFSGSDQQHVRNVLNRQNTHQAKKRRASA